MTTEELAKETMTELNALMRLALHAPEQDYSREVSRLSLIMKLLSTAESAKTVARSYRWSIECEECGSVYDVMEEDMKALIHEVSELEQEGDNGNK